MYTILAIDDKQDNLVSLSALLRVLIPDCEVITALSGPEGIEKATEALPDAVLLDIKMPGMDGFEVCRRLKAAEKTRHIPVIMLTAMRTDAQSRIMGLEMGADAFLSKPIDEAELVSQVKVALRIKKTEDALRAERDALEETVALRTMALREEIQERKRVEARLKTSNARLEALWTVSSLKDADVKTVSDHILRTIVKMTGSAYGFYGFMDEDESAMAIHAWSGAAMKACSVTDKPSHFPIAEAGVWGEAVRKREPLILNDYRAEHPAKKGLPKGHVRFTNLLVVPLISGGRIISVAAVADRPLPYDQDDVTQITSFLHNVQAVVDAKRAEEALRRSEEKYRALVAGLPDIIMRFDREGRHLFVSENVTEVVDLTPSQFIGKTHRDLGFPAELCAFWEDAIRKVFDAGQPLESEFRFQGPKGEIIFDWRLVPERDEEGRVNSVLSIARDVTAHRRMEEDYRTLFREMLDGFALHEIICDDQGRPTDYRFLAVNPAFERLTGLKGSEIVGKTVREVLPQIESYWIEIYGRTALTGEPVHFEEFSKSLGRHYEVTAFRPAPNQFATIFTDVSDRKRAEEKHRDLQARLQQAQKMEAMGTLAGGIAHDFNNILSPLMLHAEMAMMDIPKDSPLHTTLGRIYKSAERARDLVRQILTFARAKEVQKVPIKVSSVVKEALKLLRAGIPSTIEIRHDILTDRDTVLADPTQIYQLIMNLCTNAFHAMRETGGQLNVTLTEADWGPEGATGPGPTGRRALKISVRDSGPGIAPEVMDRIFDPYFTTKEQGDGTGLGLAVVHGIVMGLGGEITVESQPGQGAVFHVLLPLADRDPSPPARPAAKLPKGTERVLLVDDDLTLIQATRQMLERLGYRVEAKTNSMEALDLFRKTPGAFDLVITDQTMPHLTGRGLARELLRVRPDLPVILCTGYTDQVDDRGAKDFGIRAVIGKPIVIREIALTIRKVLDNKE